MCWTAGNVSSIADFMFGSAFLGTGDPAASAQNLSRVVLSSRLPLDTQYQVFVQAIGQTLQQAQPEAAAVLLAAALAASETAAGSQGFALVSLTGVCIQRACTGCQPQKGLICAGSTHCCYLQYMSFSIACSARLSSAH